MPPSASFVGAVLALANCCEGGTDLGGIAAFIAISAAGAIGMTVLDWWMARQVTPHAKETSTFRIAPSVAPLRGGAWGGVAGSW